MIMLHRLATAPMTGMPAGSKVCSRNHLGMGQRITRTSSSRPQQIDVFLQPGEYFIADASYRIRTLLGSCVSVALWSPHFQMGAMSHFLLLSRGGRKTPLLDVHPAELDLLDARYGDEALCLMLAELSGRGIQPWQCQAKIFGGGDMFPLPGKHRSISIGRRNGEGARALLLCHGIEVVSESLFGLGHRQIIFDVASGHVWSRQIRPRV